MLQLFESENPPPWLLKLIPVNTPNITPQFAIIRAIRIKFQILRPPRVIGLIENAQSKSDLVSAPPTLLWWK